MSLGRIPLNVLATVVAAILAAVVGVPTAAAAQSGLNILLSNDDGYEAGGILAVRDALIEAGHRVTIVAPMENRSGSGASYTVSGTLDYYPQEDGVWAVDGTPVDAVTLGLVHVLRADPPDLVISGANFGQNAGAGVLGSGTVGGALTASRAGVPAIALSVAIDLREAESSRRFSSTTDAFAPAADFLVELVGQLEETGGGGLLPPRTILNVNYPAVGPDEPAGVRFTTVSSVRSFRQLFSVGGDQGPARVRLVPGNVDQAEEGSDVALLAADYVTISVLDGDIDAGRESWEPLLHRLIIER
jgi:5'/3'-nucleotidase